MERQLAAGLQADDSQLFFLICQIGDNVIAAHACVDFVRNY